MRNVVLVAPYATANTLRYIEALCGLDGVRPALISADPLARFPKSIQEKLAAFETVASAMDGQALGVATKRISRSLGAVDRLLGVLE
ncbi:MAG: hypothetical protein ACNA8W_10615, partial [Bradymonadaceae bacterium]